MTRLRSLFGTLLVVALLALAGGMVYAQDAACPLGGYPAAEGEPCTTEITIQLAYPDWLGESPAAQTAVGELLRSVRDGFLTELSASYGEFFSNGYLATYFVEYEHGAALRSIVFTVDTYTGGAHGNSMFQTITVDTIADRVLTLEDDIFIPGADIVAALQPFVVSELTEQQGEYANAEWIASGTDELMDYSAWAINAGNLELFFGPYQVAAYAMGSFQVSVPVDALFSVINPMLIP